MSILLSPRVWNIALRTAHLAAMGILLGGHAFDVPAQQLRPSLWMTVGTGLALAAVETAPSLVWLHQLRGLMTLAKLGLIAMVPWFWPYRLGILLVVVVLASVGSHMPARFRYYSVIYRQVLRDQNGPSMARWIAEQAESPSPTQEMEVPRR